MNTNNEITQKQTVEEAFEHVYKAYQICQNASELGIDIMISYSKTLDQAMTIMNNVMSEVYKMTEEYNEIVDDYEECNECKGGCSCEHCSQEKIDLTKIEQKTPVNLNIAGYDLNKVRPMLYDRSHDTVMYKLQYLWDTAVAYVNANDYQNKQELVEDIMKDKVYAEKTIIHYLPSLEEIQRRIIEGEAVEVPSSMIHYAFHTND